MKAVGLAGLLACCALAAPAHAQDLPTLVPTFDVTVRGGEAESPVRIGHFTPRVAAMAALEPTAIGGGDGSEALGLGVRWDSAVQRAFGLDAAIGLSGAVLLAERDRSTEGVAFGATVSALGVDLSGRYAQRDGDADDMVSFGATVAAGAWTVGGAVSLGVESAAGVGAQPGASVEASYALTPGVRVGGVLAIGEDAQGAARDAGAVAAGMSMRLDF